MKKNLSLRFTALFMALAVALFTAACSSDDSSLSSSETTTTTATAAAEESTAEDSSSEDDTSSAEETESAEEESSSEEEKDSSSEVVEETATQGAVDIEILDADSGNTSLSSGSAQVTIGDKTITLNGAYVVDGVDAVVTGGTYETSDSDTNVFLVINGGSLTLSNATINKSGDAGSNDSQRTSDVSDDYNFYGMNSVILVVGEGSTATVKDCNITSDASGANAIFSTENANIDVDNVSISTTGNSARGVYATYEGTITAKNVSITTVGAHCAPVATDRGGGYVTVTDSKFESSGDGSPSIYSTGEITVENCYGISTGAQAACIEGKNSITMTDCTFETTSENGGVMLYQSMSGDAADSDATSDCSTLTMSGTTITMSGESAMFYITNTTSVINLNGGNTLTTTTGELVSAATGRWGNDGSNGGSLTLNITDESFADTVSADDISSVTVNLSGSAELTGETSGDVTVN